MDNNRNIQRNKNDNPNSKNKNKKRNSKIKINYLFKIIWKITKTKKIMKT